MCIRDRNLLDSFHTEKRKFEGKIQTPAYRMPGFAGHLEGHQHVCGLTPGAICLGEAGRLTKLNAIGPGAPGTGEREQVIKSTNLQEGAVLPAGIKHTKGGYTGHLGGKNYSTNFGESFLATSEKLLKSANPGHIPHVGEYPEARPQRLQCAIAGYSGFRPRSTPGYF